MWGIYGYWFFWGVGFVDYFESVIVFFCVDDLFSDFEFVFCFVDVVDVEFFFCFDVVDLEILIKVDNLYVIDVDFVMECVICVILV